MAYLVLVRHGLTGWNKEGRWQGFTDISISDEGKQEIKKSAQTIKDIKIDVAYTSNLIRTKQTYQQLCDSLSLSCPVYSQAALNERDYGIYNGKNKWEVEKQLGKEEFEKLRRNFDYPIPAGETLKNVYERIVPFYKTQILGDLKSGKNVLLVSSGNTFRALLKYLENISDEDIAKLELGFGDVYVFEVDEQGQILNKQIRAKGLHPVPN
jgi:2,3-bisphosphoglycerate-dependent phosphoglycerate mutase